MRKTLIPLVAFLFFLETVLPRSAFCADSKPVPFAPLPSANLDKPLWQIVTMGEITADPIPLSFGAALLTNARTLAACSFAGSLVWSYAFGELPNFVSADGQDFLYAVSGNSRLQKLNPSGRLLWKINTQEKILYQPLPGRDGRVFVVTEKAICCYDTHGKRKWRTELPRRAGAAPFELNDGSILIITLSSGGATAGLRVSPFGRLLEEITFMGTVQNAVQTADGVLLAFSSGIYGLCAVLGGTASSVWVTTDLRQPLTFAAQSRFSAESRVVAVLYAEGAKTHIRFIDPASGNILAVVKDAPLDPLAIRYAAIIGRSLAAADSNTALALDTNAALAAKDCALWRVSLPDSSRSKYIFYSEDGTLFLSGSNWVTAGYRVYQPAGQPSPSPFLAKTYEGLRGDVPLLNANFPRFGINQQELGAISAGLRRGDYGEKELAWFSSVSLLAPFLTSRYIKEDGISARVDNSAPVPVTVTDITALVLTMGEFKGSAFTSVIAFGIQHETDPALLRNLIKAASEIAYDPAGALLTAISFVPGKHGDSSIVTAHFAACDAIVAICAYMGVNALNQKGKAVLAAYISPNFDARIRGYALNSLKKLL
ncbi:MAG: PQQ-binding-like beta-propeller repeat protein [Treponemataceae bacterium]|nr:MAG: PQQ-binding-like beta-propeller repeat protein [Treponemataceae bacterium]